MYKQDSIVDLTLKVRDLWFPNTQVWNAQKVFDTFTEDTDNQANFKQTRFRCVGFHEKRNLHYAECV
ncbi:BnaCnng20500D [Brassica napus]|uniref:BnaCnng20500D protein n=1 Tax=Brassica napus TaxID=3708 RepID=A0A078IJT4_BRANA|nr:BnaCnng20500D [Brassica napus]